MKKLWIEQGDVVMAERHGEKRPFPCAFADACDWLGVDYDEADTKLDASDDGVATWDDAAN